MIYLPYRGIVVCHFGTDEVVGDANQVVFIKGGERYRMSGPVDGGAGALTITPRVDIVAEHGEEPGARAFIRTRAACPRLQLLRARLLHRAARAALADRLESEELVLALLRCVFGRRTRPHPVVGAKTARLIRHAKEFLAAELSNPIRLDDVGRAVGASPVYLTELFRRVEGVSLHQYLTRLRLARALADLPDADDLTALALEIGFSSHSHFSAVFRRVFGATPSQCRALMRDHARSAARSAAIHLLGSVAGERRIAARDRLTLGVRRHGLEVVEPVRRPRLDEVDHALRPTPAVAHDHLTRHRPPLGVVRRERVDNGES